MRTPIGFALITVLFVAGACGGGATRSSGSHGSPSASTISAASPSPSPSGPQPVESNSVLLPGTYYTSHFSPRITFTIRDPWWALGEEATAYVMNPGVSETEEEGLGFMDVERVFEPSNQRVPVKAPKDLVAWFVHHPGLKFVVKPHPVEIGGVRGTEFDLELGKAPLCPPNPNLPPGGRCWLFGTVRPGNPFSPSQWAGGPPWGIYATSHGDSERQRLVILHVQGHTLVIGWGDYPNVFAANVRLFEEVIQTIRFG